MERYVRQKYQYRSLEEERPRRPSRRDTVRVRSPSPEGSPPPLPPKAFGSGGGGGRFFDHFGGGSGSGRGLLRSSISSINLRRPSSSAFASSYRPQQRSPPPLIPSSSSENRPPAVNGEPKDPAFEAMMDALRQLGFRNERRNAIVLRELDGNFDKSIETLRRVGEGGGTPSVQAKPATTTSPNPFDMLDQKAPPPPQAGKSYNPFDQPTVQPSLENSFQGLQVSQPLFPHSTGGYPNGQVQARFTQQPLTPPVPGSLYQQQTMAYPGDGQQNNPFFQMTTTTSQLFSSNGANPSSIQQQQQQTTNPFFAPQRIQQQQVLGGGQIAPADIPASQQLRHASTMPTFSASPFFSSPYQQQQNPNNPFQQSPMISNGYPFQQQQQFAAQSLAPQQTGRIMDKSSILSLYNLTPNKPVIAEPPQQQQQQQHASSSTTPAHPNPLLGPPRSATYPNLSSGESMNPFASSMRAPHQTAVQAQPLQNPVNGGGGGGFSTTRAHLSQPSVDINGLQGGRHSPDAFASLSARYA